MRFNFDAQWLAAVTYGELVLLRICVSNQLHRSTAETMKMQQCSRAEALKRHTHLAKLEQDLLRMEETARNAPVDVIPQ